MQTMPFFHHYDLNTKRLSLRGASYVPKELFKFSQEIEILDLSEGMLTELPEELSQLKHLKVLFCSKNPFVEVPKVLAQCEQLEVIGFKACQLQSCTEHVFPAKLRWLILTDNKLQGLPESIGQLKALEKLSLTGNQLSNLPESMQNCQALEFLRISANQFTQAPPKWIFQLPKLAWYGDNGNPFCEQFKTKKITLPDIYFNELDIKELVGQSPSSEVFKGTIKSTLQQVAIKLYRGQLTSDGFPADDMYAAMAAGFHDNLIKIIGNLKNVPDVKKGLVLEFIPKTFKALGLPPSLNSCSRDTYPVDLRFSCEQVKSILNKIASACAYLHKQGIAHGDLYAHNILTNTDGEAFLGDFGAASFYDNTHSNLRERIEVRAFGCLMEELLSRCNDINEHSEHFKLKTMQDSCMQKDIQARPLFEDIKF